MFELAWNGKGMTLVLNNVPDSILDLMVSWTNSEIEKENSKMPRQ